MSASKGFSLHAVSFLLIIVLGTTTTVLSSFVSTHVATTNALSLQPNSLSRSGCSVHRLNSLLLMARKRGKRLDQELSTSSTSAAAADVNWTPLPDSLTPATSLPKQPDQVQFLDTQLPALTNPATNPTGAVAVVQHGSKTYCFSSACPSCKIPLSKARVVERDGDGVVLSCDFCSATYALKSGARVEALSKSGGGLFSGVVSSLLEKSPQSAGPLRMYKLGQVGGKLVIALD